MSLRFYDVDGNGLVTHYARPQRLDQPSINIPDFSKRYKLENGELLELPEPYTVQQLNADMTGAFKQLPIARRELFGEIALRIKGALELEDVELAALIFEKEIKAHAQADPAEVAGFEALFAKLVLEG